MKPIILEYYLQFSILTLLVFCFRIDWVDTKFSQNKVLLSVQNIEICDNGLDDDQDGYIDCYDKDCNCFEDDDCSKTVFENNFATKLAWQSLEDLVAVSSTPIVANLNSNEDDIPEIICGISNSLVQTTSNRLLIFRGDGLNASNPKELIIPGGYDMYPDAKPVVGDVNADGIPELIIVSANRRILVFSDYNENGTDVMNLIATSDDRVANEDYSAFLADFDQDGISEIYCGNEVYKFDFSSSTVQLERVLIGTGSAGILTRKNFQFRACSPIAADLLTQEDCLGDPDCAGLEIAAGNMIYSIDLDPQDGDGVQIKVQRDLNSLQNNYTYFDGYTSVADMNLDGVLDIIVAGRRNNKYGVYVWDKNNLIQFFPKPISDLDDLFGALPCIANVYDDTKDGFSQDFPEIIISSRNAFLCMNLHSAQSNPSSPYWWNLPARDRSGLTGATVFDFDGDGLLEIIYRDEDNLRIMYGGNVPFPFGVDNNRNWEIFICGSGTFDEHPVIADIDNDKEAEIILTGYTYSGYNTPASDYRGRLRVFESDRNLGGPWISARNLWNQFSYFVTNINDDLTVPRNQQQHHLPFPDLSSNKYPYNNYLSQVSILNNEFEPFLPLPDVNVEVIEVVCQDDSVRITLNMCNLGNALIPTNMPISVYDGNPLMGAVQLVTKLDFNKQILANDCVSLTVTLPNGQPNVLYLIVNDDNSLLPPFDFLNDFPVSSVIECDYSNNIIPIVIENEFSQLELGKDTFLCESFFHELDAGLGYNSYLWQNGETTQNFAVIESGLYWVEVANDCGLIQRDSIRIEIGENTEINIDTIICIGDIVIIQDQQIPIDSSKTFLFVSSSGCDSIVTVNVKSSGNENTFTLIDTMVCKGDAVYLENTFINSNDSVIFIYKTSQGCDSIIMINVGEFETYQFEDTINICHGDSALIFGQFEKVNGDYFEYHTSFNGCDSIYQTTLTISPEINYDAIITPSCNDLSNGSINIQIESGVSPYDFEWENLEFNSTNLATNLLAGDYSVTVIDANNCEYPINVTVDLLNTIIANPIIVDPSCYGLNDGSLTLDSNLVGLSFSLDGVEFQEELTFSNLEANNFTLHVKYANDCILMEELFLNNPSQLLVVLPEDTSLMLGCQIEISSNVNVSRPINYKWIPENFLNCVDCDMVVANPINSIKYTVVVQDTNSCESSDSIMITIDKPRDIYIPNVFSPNSDNVNEFFIISGGKGIKEISSLKIYSRWGELVFNQNNFPSNDIEYAWDGTFNGEPIQKGVYVYIVEIEFLDGEIIKFSGDVTILR